MQTRASRLGLAFSAVLGLSTLARGQSQSPAQGAADKPAAAPVTAATATVSAPPTPEQTRQRFISDLRRSFLDRQGAAPLPEMPRLSSETAAGLDDLRAQVAAVRAGRRDEPLAVYMDMVVLVAERLGIDPPESAIPAYRDRLQPAQAAWPDELLRTRIALAAEAQKPGIQRRFVYIDGLEQKTTADAAAMADAARAEAAAKIAAATAPRPRVRFVVYRDKHGHKHRKKKVVYVRPRVRKLLAPLDPPGMKSVMDRIDWAKAEDLASAAEEGASGWDDGRGRRARRARRRRRGRCYEWVRMALDKVGLWTDDYRTEVSAHYRARRLPVRAYSFAWAMNIIEDQTTGDRPPPRKVPLEPLDLRVDPLVIGSVVVFDHGVCGFDRRSGHIEVITSVDPLQASSYKFHKVKPDCLIQAASSQPPRVHVYVPTVADEPPSASL